MPTLAEIAEQHPSVTRRLAKFHPAESGKLVSALLTMPEYQANALRLEALAGLVATFCTGKRIPGRDDVAQWLDGFSEAFIRMEDPPEDTFVGNVATVRGNFRVYRGLGEGSDFWTEEMLSTLLHAATPRETAPSINDALALLRLSETVATRLGHDRNAAVESPNTLRLVMPKWRHMQVHAEACTFRQADLSRLGIDEHALAPFCLPRKVVSPSGGLSSEFGPLQRYPLLRNEDAVLLLAPSAVVDAVRLYLLERLKELGLLDAFQMSHHVRQLDVLMNDVLSVMGARPGPPTPPLPKELYPNAEQFGTFDGTKYIHVLLMPWAADSILQNGWAGFEDWRREACPQLYDHVVNGRQHALALPGCTGGLTLVVPSGLGQGLMIELPNNIERWGSFMIPLHDLHLLADSREVDTLRLWRFHRNLLDEGKRGLGVMNPASFLNLYAFWRQQGFMLLDRRMPFEQGRKALSLLGDFAFAMRKELRPTLDTHAVPAHHNGDYRIMARYNLRPIFKHGYRRPVYVDRRSAGKGLLRGLIVARNSQWWLEQSESVPEGEHRGTAFRLWECVLNWLASIVIQLDHRSSPMTGSFCVRLSLLDLPNWTYFRTGETRGMQDRASMQVSVPEKTITLTIPEGFMPQFNKAENDAEVALVQLLLAGCCPLLTPPIGTEETGALLHALVPNKNIRHFHVVRTNSPRAIIYDDMLSRPLVAQPEDYGFVACGLAYRIGCPPGQDPVRGVEECRKFLQKAVDHVWERLECRLKELNRRSIVETCFRNLDQLHLEEEQWRLTASAVSAISLDPQDSLQAAHQRDGERDAATLGSRILIETALYASSDKGGQPVTESDLTLMLGEVGLLVTLASHRDAILCGFSPPEIRVHPNGEIEIDTDFFSGVWRQYTEASFADQYARAAGDYASYFMAHDPAKSQASAEVVQEIDPAFRAEFGISASKLIEVGTALNDEATRCRSAIFSWAEDTLRTVLRDKAGLSNEECDAIIDRFTLRPRASWNGDIPAGCEEHDLWPWRFRRRLSLLARPFVLTTLEPKPFWLLSPPFIADALAYTISTSRKGHFPSEYFSSREMQALMGSIAQREGNLFNDEVARVVSSLGWNIRVRIAMAELGGDADGADLGDIDVLAWKTGDLRIWIIECKRLRRDGTPREVMDRLLDFHEDETGDIARHLRRVDWLQRHAAPLSRLTAIPEPDIQLMPLLVTNGIVPLQFFEGFVLDTAQVVPLQGLAKTMTAS
jgi:hypothetical protein